MSSYLFFSYSEKDAKFADKLHFDLTQRGLSLWKYNFRNTVGDDFVRKINQALQDSTGIIALLSQNYITSQYCPMEFNIALDLKIPIFPIVIDNLNESLLPFHWQRMVFVKFSENTYSVSLSKLMSGINEKNAFVTTPTCSIVLKRKSEFSGGANPFTIYFDDRAMCEVGNGKTVEFRVEAGTYAVKAAYRIHEPSSGAGRMYVPAHWREGTTEVLPFSFQSGKRYIFECGYLGGLVNTFKSVSPLYLRIVKVE